MLARDRPREVGRLGCQRNNTRAASSPATVQQASTAMSCPDSSVVSQCGSPPSPPNTRGYLTKDAGAEEIRRALEQVASDQVAIDPAVQHHLVDAIAATRPAQPAAASAARLPGGLTPREAEVLALIADGLSNTEIAARLVVSEATVKSHINHLLTKIGARDRAQAVSYAYQHGLVSPPTPGA